MAQRATVASSRQSTDRAAELLERSMQTSFGRDIVAVISQRDPNNEAAFQTVKVERNRAGQIRQTVLHPLRMQGIESIDDGKTSLMYLPDQKVLIEQDSPQMEDSDVELRVRLAQRNYTLRTEPGGSVAGRTTICLVANPKFAGVDSRRYYLDAQTAYPLKLTTKAPDGEQIVRFEAKDVQFPASLDQKLFKMRPMGGVTRLRYARRETLDSPSEAQRMMGFRPNLSVSIPLGFRVSEMQTNDSPQWKSMVVRLTDGLVKATLYQWKSTDRQRTVDSVENRTSGEANGVRMLLVSELNADLREQLLGAFMTPQDWQDSGPFAPSREPSKQARELSRSLPMLSDLSSPDKAPRSESESRRPIRIIGGTPTL